MSGLWESLQAWVSAQSASENSHWREALWVSVKIARKPSAAAIRLLSTRKLTPGRSLMIVTAAERPLAGVRAFLFIEFTLGRNHAYVKTVGKPLGVATNSLGISSFILGRKAMSIKTVGRLSGTL